MDKPNYQGTIPRLLIGLLLPVLLVLILLNIIMLFIDHEKAAGFLLLSTLYGFLLMGVPSLIYTLLMEYVINRRLDNDYWVWLSGAFIGAVSGMFFLKLTLEFNAFVLFGALSGGVCAYILRRHFKQKNLHTPVPTVNPE